MSLMSQDAPPSPGGLAVVGISFFLEELAVEFRVVSPSELETVEGGMMNLPNRVTPMPPGWGSPVDVHVNWGKVKEIATDGVAVLGFVAGLF
jgi:hypothetical protein